MHTHSHRQAGVTQLQPGWAPGVGCSSFPYHYHAMELSIPLYHAVANTTNACFTAVVMLYST